MGQALIRALIKMVPLGDVRRRLLSKNNPNDPVPFDL